MPLRVSLPLVPLLIAVNAFFVAAEYALVAIRSTQIEAMRGRGQKRAANAVERLKHDPAGAIGAIQVCITMANLLLGWIGEPAVGDVLARLCRPLLKYIPPNVFEAVSFGLSFVLVTLFTVVFSELLPKALTLRYVPAVAMLTAVPVWCVLRFTRPLVRLMNGMANLVTKPLGLGGVDEMEKEWHTAEEIKLITSEAAEQGALTPRQRSLILNSLALNGRTVRQIMVPRVRVAWLDLRKSMDENRRVMNEHLYSRLPLCDGSLDRVVGVVHTKEFLAAYHAAGDTTCLQLLASAPHFVPDTLRADGLLTAFAEQQTEFLFLADEYGGVEGIVTLADVVDELVGRADAPVTSDK